MSDENKVPDWSDDVIKGVTNTVGLLNYMLKERSQLYGTIIYLMQLLGTDKVIMPLIESMKEYHDSFYVMFNEEEGDFFVSIKPREELDGKES